MGTLPSRVLYCDYQGQFHYSETLSRLGYLVDHVRPDALKHVNLDDHDVYLFSFETEPQEMAALQTCEKLKAAELKTPLILMSEHRHSEVFQHHSQNQWHADLYVVSDGAPSALLDALDTLVGSPLPTQLRNQGSHSSSSNDELEAYKKKILELEEKVKQLEETKPKLQALLKGQKLQFQTENERLQFELSELEAKLMEREARLKEQEGQREKYKATLEELTQQHEKSLDALREFYSKSEDSKSNSKTEES